MTHEDFQKARRISRSIQDYLERTGENDLPSTEVYEFLAKDGLVETDRHKGIHFRRFLKKLLDNNVLSELIPQCKYELVGNDRHEWHFYKVNRESTKIERRDFSSHLEVKQPKLSEDEIDTLIKKSAEWVKNLPKREFESLTPQQKEIRKSYPRAYEYWSEKEIKLLKQAFDKFGRIDKVSELLQRQPHVVKDKLEKTKD